MTNAQRIELKSYLGKTVNEEIPFNKHHKNIKHMSKLAKMMCILNCGKDFDRSAFCFTVVGYKMVKNFKRLYHPVTCAV